MRKKYKQQTFKIKYCNKVILNSEVADGQEVCIFQNILNLKMNIKVKHLCLHIMAERKLLRLISRSVVFYLNQKHKGKILTKNFIFTFYYQKNNG